MALIRLLSGKTRIWTAILCTIKDGAPGLHIRAAGLDFSEGDCLLSNGRIITARDAGLLAAMNRPWVKVRRKPRVAILSTGDEIVMPGDPVGPNRVSANSIGLAAIGVCLAASRYCWALLRMIVMA